MNLQAILTDLRMLPWVSLIWLGTTVLIALMVWQFTLAHDNKDWLRWANERIRDKVIELQRQLTESEYERQQLKAEVAELEGMVEGAKMRLMRPQHLELVEKNERK